MAIISCCTGLFNGAKNYYITQIYCFECPIMQSFLHCRIGFKFVPGLCNFLRCCKAYHVGIGLHYRIVFEFIFRLLNLYLHYRVDFELIV